LALNQTQLFPPVTIKKILLMAILKIACLSTMIIKNNQYKMKSKIKLEVSFWIDASQREE
jgi:hypothetical protein